MGWGGARIGAGRPKLSADKKIKKAIKLKPIREPKTYGCAYCGKEFSSEKKRKYCSKECCLSANKPQRKSLKLSKCAVCGKPLTKEQKLYCSPNCRSIACSRRKGVKPLAEYRQRVKEESINNNGAMCINCGNVFVKHTGGNKTIGSGSFCSRQCYAEWRKKQPKQPKEKQLKPVKYCKICGKEMKNTRAKFCSEECIKEQNRRWQFEKNSTKKIIKPRSCKECGKVFTPEYGDKRKSFCSEFCLKKYGHRVHKAVRRARERNNNYESFDPFNVFKRDKWTCQLCRIKTPKRLRGTIKDNAPELDHIIPLAQGGEHSMRNTQCLCRKCNQDKGATARGQLRLFG